MENVEEDRVWDKDNTLGSNNIPLIGIRGREEK